MARFRSFAYIFFVSWFAGLLAFTVVVQSRQNYDRIIPVVHAANKTLKVPLKDDLYVESGFPYTITYDQRNLYVGYDTSYGKKITRLYFRPDYQKLKDKHIAKEQIISAKLYLYAYYVPLNSLSFRIYTPNSNWLDYETTYFNQPQSTYYTYKNVSMSGSGFISFPLTSKFVNQYNSFVNSGESFGFMIKYADESKQAVRFWSNECLVAPSSLKCPDSSYLPYVLVEYQDNSIPVLGSTISPENSIVLTNKNVLFTFNQATDEDNDILKYRVVISKNSDFSDILKSSSWYLWNDIKEFDSDLNHDIGKINLSVPDGTWFWRLEVKDNYANIAHSDGLSFVVDTTPPEVPQIQAMPPYVKGTNNVVSLVVYDLEDHEQFEYQASLTSDFANFLTSGWVNDLSYTFNNLNDTKYYYRVRAKDKYGNISNFSHTVSAVQDNSVPALVYFKSNRLVVDPKKDKLILSARFYDKTLLKIGIVVYKDNKEIAQKIDQDVEYIKFEVPNISKFSSGKYYAYAFAIDKFGHKKISKAISIIIDNDNPVLRITGTKLPTKKYINYSSFIANAQCTDNLLKSTLSIYLNNKKIYSGNSRKYTFRLKDKSYNLKFMCKDELGHTVFKTYAFVVDTKKPSKPVFSYNVDINKKTLQIKTKCSSSEVLYLFYKEKYQQIKCDHGYAKFMIKNIAYETRYVFSGYLQDQAGNKSESSHISVLTPKAKEIYQKPSKITCYVKYNVNTFRYTTKECVLNNPLHTDIIGYYKNNRFYHKFNFNLPQTLELIIKPYGCKPVSVSDPRTLFMCVPIEYEMHKETATFGYTVLINNKKMETKFSPKGSLLVYLSSKDLLKQAQVQIHAKLFKRIRLDGVPGSFFDIKWTDPLIFSKTLKLPFIKRTSPGYAYFSWMFDKNKYNKITQWYGNTWWNPHHTGIDISVNKQTPIKAPADGVVYSFGYHKGNWKVSGGYWISLKHNNGLFTYYWHIDGKTFKKFKIYKGKKIKRGEYFALSGASGHWMGKPIGAHLHFEVRTGKYARTYLDPVNYLDVNWHNMKVCKSLGCDSGHDPRKN